MVFSVHQKVYRLAISIDFEEDNMDGVKLYRYCYEYIYCLQVLYENVQVLL